MIRLGILGSTRGSNLLPLVDAINNKQLSASIEVVVSNKPEAGLLEKAAQFNLPHHAVAVNGLSRKEYDAKLSQLFQQYQVDLIVLIGYMRILSAEFVATWQEKIINVHPSLLPDFAGLMDLQVHQAVLDAGKVETGCTVHYVTPIVDAGPTIIQKKCKVHADDSAESLKARVQQLEGQALIAAIQQIAISLLHV